MSRRDVELRFSLHSDCVLVVTLTNAPAIDAEDVDVIDEVFRIHVRTLRRIAAANSARETRRNVGTSDTPAPSGDSQPRSSMAAANTGLVAPTGSTGQPPAMAVGACTPGEPPASPLPAKAPLVSP